MTLRKSMHYAAKVFRHKYYVFRYGLITGVPLRALLIHDCSKFSNSEFYAYRDLFDPSFDSLDEVSQAAIKVSFDYAWRHHVKMNPHHWEYWVERSPNPPGFTHIPEPYLAEMAADWLAASRVYAGRLPPSFDDWDWLIQNHTRIFPKLSGPTILQLYRHLRKAVNAGEVSTLIPWGYYFNKRESHEEDR